MRLTIFSIVFLSSLAVQAQDTVDYKQLNQVVITATRTERKLGNVAVPVQIVNGREIKLIGSQRLQDVLGEQTGLYITSSGATTSAGGGVFGNGIQVQGLSPDYTLILLDGEPLIGRQGGVLDLSRITVSQIKRIEIVKGPSSSLYGSEAMGGVVNIITEQPQQTKLDASLRYGRFNNTDANLGFALKSRDWGLQISGNRNSSDGFDLDKNAPGKTVDPYKSYTTQFKFFALPSTRTRIGLSARFYDETQQNYFLTSDVGSGTNINITGQGEVKDINIAPSVSTKFSDKLQSSLRLYFSRYQYEQDLLRETDHSTYYHDFFQQDYYRAETQTDIQLPANNLVSIGGGLVKEKLNTTRYAGKRSNDNQYLFAQDEWKAGKNLIVIGGLRFDNNTAYQSRLSPKLAAQYKIGDKLRISASYGAGFKAPDFRQLFLNFFNSAAGGYVVYGANEINITEIQRQKQEGIINEILPRAYQLALLKPEISKGLNAGARYDCSDRLSLNMNLFRNDISNLIQVDIIAYRANGAPVYSYFNVKEAYTEGGEFNVQYHISSSLTASGGYQYLITADKSDLKRIASGSVFTRDLVSNETYKVRRGDYAGLPNRSAHMVNGKLFYESARSGWSGSLRVLYRSRWGTYDKDGNGLINRSDEFAKGFAQVNISAGKTINGFTFRAGVDNLTDYQDRINLPAEPGIQPYILASYTFIKKHK